MVLGGGEVRLLDMTHAYGVFANRGIKVTPRSILRVEDGRGTVVDEFETESTRVLDANVADMVSDVLSDNVARSPLWGSYSLVNFGERDVAIKSGSTNNLRDAWLMGYAPNLAVGVWVGNNDNSAMGGGLSGLIATPMWREFLDIALAKLPVETFTQPQITTTGVKPIIRGEYVDASQLLNNLGSSTEDSAVNISAIYSNIHNILHYVERNNPQGPYPSDPRQDPQYDNWEWGVQKWKEATFGSLINEQTEAEAADDAEEEQGNQDRRNSRSD